MGESKVPLVEDNIGLAKSCASRFTGRGIEYDDLFQAACEGLVRASLNFDISKGYKFSTYAVPVILGEIRALFRYGGSIKVGRRLRSIYKEIKDTAERFQQINGYEPSVAELSEITKFDRELIVESICSASTPLSLSGFGSEDFEADIPANDDGLPLSEFLDLKGAIQELNARERMLLSLRFVSERSQADTARALGVSQVSISRAERKVFDSLRERLIVPELKR